MGGGFLKNADLMPAADSAPGEGFSVARYRLLHHTAVSFVSSDIRVFDAHATIATRPGHE